jgi:hypothetical protein
MKPTERERIVPQRTKPERPYDPDAPLDPAVRAVIKDDRR